ncbi:hypothetical protein KP509_1Z168000 [Ceratopteris richardii]|nr:hypothetical protein KP509_1Z168000 [Ceratopteris richardii]
MTALFGADIPMQSSSSCTHFNAFPSNQFSRAGSSPLSSPTGTLSYDSSSTCSSIATAVGDEDNASDVAPGTCAFHFGDIPASSFPSGRLTMQQSPPVLGGLLTAEGVSPGVSLDMKLHSRAPSKLGCGSKSPPASQLGGDNIEHQAEGHRDEAVAAYNELCCGGVVGLCSTGSCMMGSPCLPDGFMALKKFLPSNNVVDDEEEILAGADSWPALDVYSCDDFRMYEFKVRKCVRGRSHDWTECPFAHPGEKARRRDPRRYRYSGTACPDFRKGNCRRGEACEYSHGVFECWLHPSRYRTQPCKDGKSCRRRVCFFAHTPEQLRVVPAEGDSPPVTPRSGGNGAGSTRSSLLKAAALHGGVYDGSPLRRALAGGYDGNMALELFFDDTSNKSSSMACTHHHHHHHWIGTGGSPNSTLIGLSVGATPPSPVTSPALSPMSPLVSCPSSWMGAPSHRRHLDRLRSLPTISIPSLEDTIDSPQRSPSTMSELMSTLQNLQMSQGPLTIQSCRTLPSSSSGWPPYLGQSQHSSSHSVPGTPESRYMQVNGSRIGGAVGAQSMSSASINEGVTESDVPDLGWVNELVQ